MQQRGDQLHLHPFTEREFAHHHIELVHAIEQFGQFAHDLRKGRALDAVDGTIEFQRLPRR